MSAWKCAASLVLPAAALLSAAACGSTPTSGLGPSAQDQIKQAVNQYTEALNAGDADKVNALTCNAILTTHPATTTELHKSLNAYGTYTTRVKAISIDGEHAKVQVTITDSKDSVPPSTMTVDYVHEAGSWKRCSD